MGPPINVWPYSHPTFPPKPSATNDNDSKVKDDSNLCRKSLSRNFVENLRVLCLNFTLGLIVLQMFFNLHLARAGPVVLSLDYLQGPVPIARNIKHLPCISRRTAQEGMCMFAIDCLKANGTHLGTCIDRFYFGSCCQIPDKTLLPQIIGNNIEDNAIDSANFVHPQTEDKIQDTVTQIPEKILPARYTTVKTTEKVEDKTDSLNSETKADEHNIPLDGDKVTTAVYVESSSKDTAKVTDAPTTDIPKLSTFQSVSVEVTPSKPEPEKVTTTTEQITTQKVVKPTRKPAKPTYKPRPTYKPINLTRPSYASTSTKPRPVKPINLYNTTRKPPYRPPPKRPTTKRPIPIPPRLNITILPQLTSSRPIFTRPSSVSITYINSTTANILEASTETKAPSSTSTTTTEVVVTPTTKLPPTTSPLPTTTEPQKTETTTQVLTESPTITTEKVTEAVTENLPTTIQEKATVDDEQKTTISETTQKYVTEDPSEKGTTIQDALSEKETTVSLEVEATTQQKVTTEYPPFVTWSSNTVESESKPTESKPIESKPIASRPDESKPIASKPTESKPIESKPDESKPIESKPDESKPMESRPDESKPMESRPDESKPIESKPDESKPMESRPDESKPMESIPDEKVTESDEVWSPITPPEGWILISTIPPKPDTTTTTTTTTTTPEAPTTQTTQIQVDTTEYYTEKPSTETPTVFESTEPTSYTPPFDPSSPITTLINVPISTEAPKIEIPIPSSESPIAIPFEEVSQISEVSQSSPETTSPNPETTSPVPETTPSIPEKSPSVSEPSPSSSESPSLSEIPKPTSEQSLTEVGTEKPVQSTSPLMEFTVNVTLTPSPPVKVDAVSSTEAGQDMKVETTSASSEGSSSTQNVTAAAPEATTVSSTTPESFNVSNYKEVCGRRLWPQARIVGGAKSTFGKWPWQISLRQFRTSTYLHKCGAALLNENWAITAAHCVEHVPPSELLVRLGEYDLATEDEPYGFAERRVQIVASHPHFDPATFEYDLALLRFYEPVTFQPNIIPVCVPDNDDNYVGKTAYVTGWGRLYDEGPLPSVLQEVSVPVINNTACEAMYRAAGYNEHIPNIFICAGWRRGGSDSCEGDSGGPMVVPRERDGRFVLGGVISWGIGCAEPNQPGVYTRISEFRDWINQILQF